MNHGRHIQFEHLFVQRIPEAIGQGRIAPMATRGIGIQVATNEAEFFDATL